MSDLYGIPRPDLEARLASESELKRCTVEVWDGQDEDAAQMDCDARIVDVTRIGDHWHLVVVADV